MAPPSVAVGLQGGGSHGAFAWGVLDRLLDSVDDGALHISAFSGASAGAINAALCACGLALGGPALARARMRAFWDGVARRGAAAGNALFGFAEPGLFGLNIDWSPGAIVLEAAGLVVSPYSNPFYVDALAPLLREVFGKADLAALNAATAPRLFVSATNVATNALKLFTQPDISVDALRASACLPSEFRAVQIGDGFYWDGGYIGNPALNPLVDIADDLLLVLVNPLGYERAPPTSARQILDRLNQITFNASLVLEMNAIEAVNKVLRAQGDGAGARYRQIRLHLIRDERFMQGLGFVSKSSTSAELIAILFDKGRNVADRWLSAHLGNIGKTATVDPKSALIAPVLKGSRP